MDDDRRFHLVDAAGRLFNGSGCGPLVQVRPEWDAGTGRLLLRIPYVDAVEGEVALGEPVQTDFYGERTVPGRVVEGPWAEALSAYTGEPLRLVCVDGNVNGTDIHVATLVSHASIEELSRRDGLSTVLDPRRFRMLLELDGCTAHEEDEWIGRDVRAGEALLRIPAPVPRCAVTTQDPMTGYRDFDTLRAIKDYRGEVGGKLMFGVYAEVVEPGRVRIGDPVTPVA